MSEFVAVSNSTFEIEITPAVQGSNVIATPNAGVHGPTFPAVFTIDDTGHTEDSNCAVQGDQILVTEITQKSLAVPPTTGAADDYGCEPLAVGVNTWINKGSYSILATAIKTLCSGEKVMREGDTTIVPCACNGTTPTTPPPTGVPFAGVCSVKISVAGQDKVKAE